MQTISNAEYRAGCDITSEQRNNLEKVYDLYYQNHHKESYPSMHEIIAISNEHSLDVGFNTSGYMLYRNGQPAWDEYRYE